MTRLAIPEISSPADLGLAVDEKVQELTQGRARKSASFLSALTCLELDGHDLPASPWCTLVLLSLSDLAIHAPGVTLAISDWAVHFHNMARRCGEASAREMASALVWAGCRRRNVELESSGTAVVNGSGLVDAVSGARAEAA
jgi:hypothetical protein